MNFKIKVILITTFFVLLPSIIKADVLGQQIKFNIDPSYDLFGRTEITAKLEKITNQIYFYIDNQWWDKLSFEEKNKIDEKLYNLGSEFEYKIYPILTSNFGPEPRPGVDRDERITVLIHPMANESGGYVNTGDWYPKFQNPKSNEREMLYLNANHLDKPMAKSFLAHEFLHLITFNQKDLLRGVSEETWLNELRAEYVPTLLGYNDIYEGSYLERRVNVFLAKPTDSLIEWQNKTEDYGVINLFGHYLVDHYGIKILTDSLKSEKVGIPSINEALEKNGFKENLSQIFNNWLITVLVNDCNLGQKYCYKNQKLKNLRIVPQTNLLPLKGESTLAVNTLTSDWSGNWQRIIGGGGNLKLEFDGEDSAKFSVPYLVCDKENKCQIYFLTLNEKNEGSVTISDFNQKYFSLTIIPTIENKTLNSPSKNYFFTFRVSTNSTLRETEIEIKAETEKPIAKYSSIPSGFKFERNLYYGVNNPDVVYLKIILNSEGCVSGLSNTQWFGPKTLLGVKCFQNKYKSEISQFAGYSIKATGFVGKGTLAKLNQILGD